MTASADIRRRYRSVIARAEARAAADVQIGIDDLRHALATAPEWEITGKADGSRTIEPKRMLLQGALNRVMDGRNR